jgi:hypothetical protein
MLLFLHINCLKPTLLKQNQRQQNTQMASNAYRLWLACNMHTLIIYIGLPTFTKWTEHNSVSMLLWFTWYFSLASALSSYPASTTWKLSFLFPFLLVDLTPHACMKSVILCFDFRAAPTDQQRWRRPGRTMGLYAWRWVVYSKSVTKKKLSLIKLKVAQICS